MRGKNRRTEGGKARRAEQSGFPAVNPYISSIFNFSLLIFNLRSYAI
jgi:hypothetical protein